ncbi:MAG: PriCT-2 domain-containing protein [Ferruginibacter sp.]|nr:PriCT-2 domain-containing protein [Ferruginibacter sp.]
MKFSKYKNHHEKNNITIEFWKYVEMVRNGDHQSIVFNARANRADDKKYKEIKGKLPAITGSCTMKQESRSVNNIEELNGLILLDIDSEVDSELRKKIDSDKYTFCSNRSISGTGLVVFVQINSDLFIESFHGLAQYYNDNFDVDIDQSCKDISRLRYISYDLDIFVNQKAEKFKAKKAPEKEKKKENFYFVEDDFGWIVNQIKDKNIDLCQENYKIFCEIGFSIGSQFGEAGLPYFKTICQNGSKYDPKRIESQYKKFCKDGGVKISTFYYYAKSAGCELYSEKSKKIIKRVAVGKANSLIMTPESVIENLLILDPSIIIADSDRGFIQNLINSKDSFVKLIENEENETVKLDLFIKENYPIVKNNFNQCYEYNSEPVNDEIINSITIHAKKYFDFRVNATDVSQLIFNSKSNTYNPIEDYFKNNNCEPIGNEIDEYADFILPFNEFNRWVLRRWLVGAIHNWISPIDHEEVSPLVLVLCGKQASGKTSFFRNMLPKELRRYFIDESMEEGGKDVLKRMATSMIMLNDEFGGMAAKDVKNFKKITEKNKITVRLPYGRLDVDLKRRTMLCGTTNDSAVLKDETGNRRILPIEFESVNYEGAKNHDKDLLLKCAYNLYKDGFQFRVFSKEDIEYLNKNTYQNLEVEVSEDLFFTKFSLTENEDFNDRVILNQGEICNYMNIYFSIIISKYDIKRICLKNKMELKTFRSFGKIKTGYELFKEPEYKKEGEAPF